MDLPVTQPPLHVVLFEPDIPPNTGNIARLCAGTGTILHLIEPLGFRLTDQAMKRAGLDYWDAVTMLRHKNMDAFLEEHGDQRIFLLSTKGKTAYTVPHYQPGDTLVFGSETRGLPSWLHERFAASTLTIPMLPGTVRSMNLANSVAIVLYETIRQIHFEN